jgi:hypothetical protein
VKAGFHWIVQVARCCGAKYKRQRLPGCQFPGSHHEHCVHCKQPLIYARSNLKETRNARQRRARAEQVRQGLTVKGTIRQHKLRPELGDAHGSARHTAYMKLQRAERKQAGLTARGTVPVLRRRQATPQEQLFAALKAEIQSSPTDLPIATGFRDEAGIARGGANGRGFMVNLITRGTERKEAA